MIIANPERPGSIVISEAYERIIQDEGEYSEIVGPEATRLFLPKGNDAIADFSYIVSASSGLLDQSVPGQIGGVEYPDGTLVHASSRVDEDMAKIIIAGYLSAEMQEQSFDTYIKPLLLRLGSDAPRMSHTLRHMCDAAYEYFGEQDPIESLAYSEIPPGTVQKNILLEEGQVFQYELEQSGIFRPRDRAVMIGRLGIDALRLDEKTPVDRNNEGVKAVELTTDRANRNHPHVCRDCRHGIGIGALRITTQVEPVEGYDHHHYHPQCFSAVET